MSVFTLLAPVPLPRQSEESMKKRSDPDELRKEYTLEDFPGGLERGKYAANIQHGWPKGRTLFGLIQILHAPFQIARQLTRLSVHSCALRSTRLF